MSLQSILAIGAGGFIGAIARAYMFHIINSTNNYPMPIATIFINILGSFMLGAIFAYMQKYQISMPIKSFITTGILGAFTTFSTFAIEAVFLLPSIKLFLIYTSFTIIGSIMFALLGYKGVLTIIG